MQELIHRIDFIQNNRFDALVKVELRRLEEEFGTENVRWALRFLEALRAARQAPGSLGESHAMWDRELDGERKRERAF